MDWEGLDVEENTLASNQPLVTCTSPELHPDGEIRVHFTKWTEVPNPLPDFAQHTLRE